MNDIRVFLVKIETTLVAYAESDLLYGFVGDIRDGIEGPNITMPVIDKSLISITEHISIKEKNQTDYFTKKEEFNNGKICKLRKAPDPRRKTKYHLDLVNAKEAAADFSSSSLEVSSVIKEETCWNDSCVWVTASNQSRDLLLKYRVALKKSSSFPIVADYEPDNLVEKCKEVDRLYQFWSLSESSEKYTEYYRNRVGYFFLRYPGLEKMFNDMKRNSPIEDD